MRPAVGRDEDRQPRSCLYPSAHLRCLMRGLFYYYENPRQRWQIARTRTRILRSDICEIRSAEKRIRYTPNFEWSSASIQVSVARIWCSTFPQVFEFLVFPIFYNITWLEGIEQGEMFLLSQNTTHILLLRQIILFKTFIHF